MIRYQKSGLWLLATMIVSFNLVASTNEEFVHITKTIGRVFANYYAPQHWKAESLQWNLPAELEALNAASLSSDVTSYHQSLKQFFQAARDYHTSIQFTNHAVSWLPITIKHIDGGFYLAYVAPNLAANFSLQRGDKITHMNGQPVVELAWSLIGNIANPTPTDWALAARKLTKRLGIAGDQLEKGPVIIEAERNQEPVYAQLVWDYSPDQTSAFAAKSMRARRALPSFSQNVSPQQRAALETVLRFIEARSYQVAFADILKQTPMENAADPQALGKKESILPPLGSRVIWSTDAASFWQAYIYLNDDNKLIGFIRIPNYVPDETKGTALQYVTQFGEIIAKMDAVTDLLVIDQLNNPGGSVFYLYTLASMLTNKPLKTPRHQFSIDSRDVHDAKEYLKQADSLIQLVAEQPGVLGDVHGYPIDLLFLQHMKSFYQFAVEQWNAGKTLTDQYFLYGVDYIQPHPLYRYTKKILMLTNELDFSGGDFFPAILQDNNRVTILGTTTAGAGGYVLAIKDRNRAGILSYHYTGSLAFRANGQPLENLGVTPDILYQVTPDDLALGFLLYGAKINEEIRQLLAPTH